MPHPESAWRAEIQAHAPLGQDRIALAHQAPELSSWRAGVCEIPHLQASVREWEAYIHEQKLAVAIEQASDDGVLAEEQDIRLRLKGCPDEWRIPLNGFLTGPPKEVRDYLTYACFHLVRIERERRTGTPEWTAEAAPGSPEVLQELMFKWGPRFRRHRWIW